MKISKSESLDIKRVPLAIAVFYSNILNVRLGDTITFNCQVNDSAEAEADLIENIVLLEEEEHLNNCDTGSKGVGEKLSVCSRQGFDYTLPITNSPELENRLSFEAGGTYYFTSEC